MRIIFLNVLNMSYTASLVILVIIVVRFLIRKVPKIFSYALWSVVLFRLLCPITFESIWSIFPQNNGIMSFESRMLESPIPTVNEAVGEEENAEVELSSVVNIQEKSMNMNPMKMLLWICQGIWAVGIFALIGYRIISVVYLRNKLKKVNPYQDNIYVVDNIRTPFVLGIIRPRIYLPTGLKEEERNYIIIHEKMHIKRLDPVIKTIAFLALCIHWFNPFVWLAFSLFGKDMEMSCDEAVLRQCGYGIKKEYSQLLLRLTVDTSLRNSAVTMFGEGNVKTRIKNILSYKQTKKGIMIIAAILTLFIILGLTGNQKGTINNEEQSMIYKEAVQTWANAFCDRDWKTIVSLTSESGKASMEKSGILMKEENGYTFGWSSPWPFQLEESEKNERYQIVSFDEKEAVIIYYAVVSDPKVIVWKESISYEMKNGEFQVLSENIKFYDSIISKQEYEEAYSNGKINHSSMDYSTNGFGEYLNMGALEEESGNYYRLLCDPEISVFMLLNISLDGQVTVQRIDAEVGAPKGAVQLEIQFPDGIQKINMIQPYGENGIWIPQDV